MQSMGSAGAPSGTAPGENYAALLEQLLGACADFDAGRDRAQAEAAILRFQHMPSAQCVGACKYVLQHTHVPTARFHAATTLRQAFLRADAANLSPADMRTVTGWCLEWCVQNSEQSQPFERAQLLSAAAIALKRSWGPLVSATAAQAGQVAEVVSPLADLLGQVENSLLNPATASMAHTCIGVDFLHALVTEFGVSSASALCLPSEYHVRCHTSFQQWHLQHFYSIASALTSSVAQTLLAGTESDILVHLCTRCIQLCSLILQWNFAAGKAIGGRIAGDKLFRNSESYRSTVATGSTPNEEIMLVEPGEEWSNMLLGSQNVAALPVQLYASFRAKALPRGLDSSPGIATRHLLVQLASLSGEIFPDDEEVGEGVINTSLREQHIVRIVSTVLEWLNPLPSARELRGESNPQLSDLREAEVVDACRAINALATIHPLALLEQALLRQRNVVFLEPVTAFTCECLAAGALTDDDQRDTWLADAMRSLLDGWLDLLGLGLVSESTSQACFRVFGTFLQRALLDASRGAYEEDDDQDLQHAATAAREDNFDTIAAIARAAPTLSLRLLGEQLQQRCVQLDNFRTHGGDSATLPALLEEMHLLLTVSGHVVADAAQGETPMVPDLICKACTVSRGNPPNVQECAGAIQLLVNAAMAIARIGTHDATANMISPRVLEVCIWMLGRWSGSYVMAGTGNAALEALYGAEGEGASVVKDLLEVGIGLLTRWPGEGDLQVLVCGTLLKTLVQRQSICESLVSQPVWQDTCRRFADAGLKLEMLPGKAVRALSMSVCLGARGVTALEHQGNGQYIASLLQKHIQQVLGIAANSKAAAATSHARVLQELSCLLEVLRGAMQGVLSSTRESLVGISRELFSPLNQLMITFACDTLVVNLLLKLAQYMAEVFVFAEPRAAEMAELSQFCLVFLNSYASSHLGRVEAAVGELGAEALAQRSKGICSLLRLLSYLTSRDVAECLSIGQEPNTISPAGDAVMKGVKLVIPILSAELLQIPKLCNLYFSLLRQMSIVFPFEMLSMTGAEFGQLIDVIHYGLAHRDQSIACLALEVVQGIAKYTYLERILKGLSPGLLATKSSSLANETILVTFLQSIMKALLYNSQGMSFIETAAGALLPMILCDIASFEYIGTTLVQQTSQHDGALAQKLGSSLQMLLGQGVQQVGLTYNTMLERIRWGVSLVCYALLDNVGPVTYQPTKVSH